MPIYTWYFYHVYRYQHVTGWSIEAAKEVILYQSSATATNTTAAAINLFFSALIPDLSNTSYGEVTTAQQQCDTLLSRRATTYTEDILEQGLAQRNKKIAKLAQLQVQKQN